MLTVDRIPIPSLWSLIVVGTGKVIWISAAVAWACSRIEDHAARLNVLRWFAAALIAIGITYDAPAFPILRVLLPSYAAWGHLVAGGALLWLSFETLEWNRARQSSDETVKTHVAHVLSKLQVENRAQAIVQALKRGLVTLEELDGA